MSRKAQYEKRILSDIRSLPEEALPRVIRLISFMKEEFVPDEYESAMLGETTNHEITRSLLSTSKTNWAHGIIADREDRI